MICMINIYIYVNSFQKCSKCLIHHQLASPFTYEHRILASWYSWRSRGSHLRSLLLPWCYPEILMVEHIGSHHLGVSIPHCHFSYLGYFNSTKLFVHNIPGFCTNIYQGDQTKAYQTWSNCIQKRSGFHWALTHFCLGSPWGQPTWIESFPLQIHSLHRFPKKKIQLKPMWNWS